MTFPQNISHRPQLDPPSTLVHLQLAAVLDNLCALWLIPAGGEAYGSLCVARVETSSVKDIDEATLVLWKLLTFSVRKNEGPRFRPDAYMTDYLSREAVAAIEANRNRPEPGG